MLKIAVCDDDPLYGESIQEIIAEYCERRNIEFQIKFFQSGNAFVALEQAMGQFHIVYLDVNMDGLDGIETARIIRRWSKDIFIVFITAFIHYTLEGYKVEATRYILKDGTLRENIQESLDAILDRMKMSEHIYEFNFKEGIRRLSSDHLIFIESNLHVLSFRVLIKSEIRTYTMNAKLSDVHKELMKEKVFARIHQSYLVNLKYVKDILNYQAILWNEDVLPISRQRYREVKELFLLYEGEF